MWVENSLVDVLHGKAALLWAALGIAVLQLCHSFYLRAAWFNTTRMLSDSASIGLIVTVVCYLACYDGVCQPLATALTYNVGAAAVGSSVTQLSGTHVVPSR